MKFLGFCPRPVRLTPADKQVWGRRARGQGVPIVATHAVSGALRDCCVVSDFAQCPVVFLAWVRLTSWCGWGCWVCMVARERVCRLPLEGGYFMIQEVEMASGELVCAR